MSLVRHPVDGRCHFSELKTLAKSPAHYKLACAAVKTPTRPMIVGAIGDCLVFGQRGYAVYPGKVRNGKEYEAWRDANPGVIQCIQSELDDAKGSAYAVLDDPVAQSILQSDGVEFQVCAQWEAYGLQCAAGIAGERGGYDCVGVATDLMSDLIPGIRAGAPFVCDLKVTSSTEPYDFSVQAWKMLWHAQLAWYLDGITANRGACDQAILIGVEASPPHNVTVLLVPPDLIEDGRRSLSLWAEKLRTCDASGQFPGYVQRGQVMVRPSWVAEPDSL